MHLILPKIQVLCNLSKIVRVDFALAMGWVKWVKLGYTGQNLWLATAMGKITLIKVTSVVGKLCLNKKLITLIWVEIGRKLLCNIRNDSNEPRNRQAMP